MKLFVFFCNKLILVYLNFSGYFANGFFGRILADLFATQWPSRQIETKKNIIRPQQQWVKIAISSDLTRRKLYF